MKRKNYISLARKNKRKLLMAKLSPKVLAMYTLLRQRQILGKRFKILLRVSAEISLRSIMKASNNLF